MSLKPNKNQQGPFQEVMGTNITRFVMWGTIIMGIVGISFSIVALNVDETRTKNAFTIIQYVFGVLLPLWGTWIGTILAYYYSKDNFESANKSVQQIVDKFTSEKKLQSVKAKDVMIDREKLIVQVLSQTEDLSKFKLKEDCLDFLKANKIRRVIILDDKDCAKYVIHRDLISYFISSESLVDNSVKGYTLKDMYEKSSTDIKSTFDNSVKFIGEDSSLLEAKNIIQQNKLCQDVFITKNANANEPILGWITDITIAENSIV